MPSLLNQLIFTLLLFPSSDFRPVDFPMEQTQWLQTETIFSYICKTIHRKINLTCLNHFWYTFYTVYHKFITTKKILNQCFVEKGSRGKICKDRVQTGLLNGQAESKLHCWCMRRTFLRRFMFAGNVYGVWHNIIKFYLQCKKLV